MTLRSRIEAANVAREEEWLAKLNAEREAARRPQVPTQYIETSRPTATRATAGWFVAGPIGAIASLAFPKHEKKAVR
jgi:hypothetical protein